MRVWGALLWVAVAFVWQSHVHNCNYYGHKHWCAWGVRVPHRVPRAPHTRPLPPPHAVVLGGCPWLLVCVFLWFVLPGGGCFLLSGAGWVAPGWCFCGTVWWCDLLLGCETGPAGHACALGWLPMPLGGSRFLLFIYINLYMPFTLFCGWKQVRAPCAISNSIVTSLVTHFRTCFG